MTESDATPNLYRRKTIFNEYNNTFSSTRAPGSAKRKTIYDISMEIIDQRLQNINQIVSARKNRSMSESDLNVDETIIENDTSNAVQSTPQLCQNGLVEKNDNVLPNNEVKSINPVVKKRKLFIPTSLYNLSSIIEMNPSQDRPASATPSKTDKKKTASSTTKKREADNEKITKTKKLMIQSKTITKPNKLITKTPLKRRQTSMDFISCTNKQQSTDGVTTTIAKSQVPKTVLPSLVTTNMHRDQQQVCKEVGKF